MMPPPTMTAEAWRGGAVTVWVSGMRYISVQIQIVAPVPEAAGATIVDPGSEYVRAANAGRALRRAALGAPLQSPIRANSRRSSCLDRA